MKYFTVSQKSIPLDNNFGKCGLIFKILSPIKENSQSTHHKDNFLFICNMLLHYLVKFKNP